MVQSRLQLFLLPNFPNLTGVPSTLWISIHFSHLRQVLNNLSAKATGTGRVHTIRNKICYAPTSALTSWEPLLILVASSSLKKTAWPILFKHTGQIGFKRLFSPCFSLPAMFPQSCATTQMHSTTTDHLQWNPFSRTGSIPKHWKSTRTRTNYMN